MSCCTGWARDGAKQELRVVALAARSLASQVRVALVEQRQREGTNTAADEAQFAA